jgi:hypothetical protein
MVELYLHYPIRLHDVVLNELSLGITLPYLTLPYHSSLENLRLFSELVSRSLVFFWRLCIWGITDL